MKKRLVCLMLALVLVMPALFSAQALTGLNSFAHARFDRGYPVFSGPGEYYYRANNGKAMYGGGGVARVYGVIGNWIMIGYELGSGDYRIGYITKTALKGMSDVQGKINYNLSFSSSTAWINGNCSLTDDPVINNKTVLNLSAGTQVTALATMGTEWTYIEVLGTSSYMRGFVRSRYISYSPVGSSNNSSYNPSYNSSYAPNTYYHDYNKGDYLPDYQTIRFSRSYPVYSGPGTYYYRANSGKATMGGGVCRLYGVENGWALIGYELNDGSFRIGYVDADGIPQEGFRIPYLDLKYTTRTLVTNASLTDDIVMYKPTILNLSAGTRVTYLGLCYGLGRVWAYVEANGASSTMRGFIPASALGM
ncbi:MAG: hypothetical protein IJE17_12290 [Clostridia bacterium]|nr:hypothetical protein [Clostridia bacterium]MBQ6805118.1 hypothetical protein [Clostridia bacterium]